MNKEQLNALINKTLNTKQINLLIDLLIINKYRLKEQIEHAQADIYKHTQNLDSQKISYSTEELKDLLEQEQNNKKLLAELSHAKTTLLVNTEAILTITE
jgi:hypothetical protein